MPLPSAVFWGAILDFQSLDYLADNDFKMVNTFDISIISQSIKDWTVDI